MKIRKVYLEAEDVTKNLKKKSFLGFSKRPKYPSPQLSPSQKKMAKLGQLKPTPMEPMPTPSSSQPRSDASAAMSALAAKQQGTATAAPQSITPGSVEPNVAPEFVGALEAGKVWNPFLQNSMFQQNLEKTKDLKQTLLRMPDKDFNLHISRLPFMKGPITKKDINNPKVFGQIVSFMGRHLPLDNQGKLLTAGKTPDIKKKPLNLGLKDIFDEVASTEQGMWVSAQDLARMSPQQQRDFTTQLQKSAQLHPTMQNRATRSALSNINRTSMKTQPMQTLEPTKQLPPGMRSQNVVSSPQGTYANPSQMSDDEYKQFKTQLLSKLKMR